MTEEYHSNIIPITPLPFSNISPNDFLAQLCVLMG